MARKSKIKKGDGRLREEGRGGRERKKEHTREIIL